MARYLLAEGVEQELDQIWDFIAKDNPDAATRVVAAAYETLGLLAQNPGLGRPRSFARKAHRNLRSRGIIGFDNYVILYREITGGIEVLHVCHGARNLNSLLRRAR